jgi:ADP-ribose pyrophosphatase YjhB (NUDIX family)
VTGVRACSTALANWRFCPLCGAEFAAASDVAVSCDRCGFAEYAHSRPTVSGICVNDAGAVLLGRRAREPGVGCWDIPGGYLLEAEEPERGLRREILEETSVRVTALLYFGAWSDFVVHATLNLIWVCRVVGEAHAGDDLGSVEWLPTDHLPAIDDFAYHNAGRAVRCWLDRGMPMPRSMRGH